MSRGKTHFLTDFSVVSQVSVKGTIRVHFESNVYNEETQSKSPWAYFLQGQRSGRGWDRLGRLGAIRQGQRSGRGWAGWEQAPTCKLIHRISTPYTHVIHRFIHNPNCDGSGPDQLTPNSVDNFCRLSTGRAPGCGIARGRVESRKSKAESKVEWLRVAQKRP